MRFREVLYRRYDHSYSFAHSFEQNMEDWQPRRTDIEIGQDTIAWHTVRIDTTASDGSHSLELYLENHNDPGKIWEQTHGQVDAFIHSVGTAGSLRGIATRLRVHNQAVHTVAVEPAESAVLSGGPSGSHKVEGTGAGFVVPLWTEGLADEIQTVSSQEVMATARCLARQEGIFAGTSAGAKIAVVLRVAERLGPDQPVVTS